MIPGLLNQKNNKPSLARNNQFVEVFIYNKAAATKRGIDGVKTVNNNTMLHAIQLLMLINRV